MKEGSDMILFGLLAKGRPQSVSFWEAKPPTDDLSLYWFEELGSLFRVTAAAGEGESGLGLQDPVHGSACLAADSSTTRSSSPAVG